MFRRLTEWVRGEARLESALQCATLSRTVNNRIFDLEARVAKIDSDVDEIDETVDRHTDSIDDLAAEEEATRFGALATAEGVTGLIYLVTTLTERVAALEERERARTANPWYSGSIGR